ncbi:MAG: AAA family ATPase, partial [Bacteroidaceae bacterium]|nr:AAA family ATPase [Bacteroidaceae bacterium]
MDIKERIIALLKEIGKGVYEKDTELRLGMLAALAGESIILLGPPGTAKSMVARRLKDAFKGAVSFEYLMSRFSTPDDIFGPVSISKLKVSDTYERVTEGYMPTADVVFLDEIWKAGPAIQNTLLTALNEKVFRNGDKEVKLPLKLLIAASNELPAEGEGLEALWDRFLVRCISGSIKEDNTFLSMILDTEEVAYSTRLKELQITPEEYAEWQQQITQVKVDKSVQTSILYIRNRMKRLKDEHGESEYSIYISDRRWKKAVNLLKASAFIHGR